MGQLSQSSWQYPYDTYQELYLENTTLGHLKFYKMTNEGNPGKWIACWGKIGTNGQSMEFASSLWMEKLLEKINKKRYVLIRATSISAASKPKGVPPPVIKPPLEYTLDADILAKFDRIILFLEERSKHIDMPLAENLKMHYLRTGVLTKEDMGLLNTFWKRNGGGQW